MDASVVTLALVSTPAQPVDPGAAWVLIVGVLTPFLVSVVNQPGWSRQRRQIVAVAVSLLIGVGTVVIGGTVSNWSLAPSELVVVVAAVVGAAQAAYALIWKPTGAAGRVEAATSRSQPYEADPPAQHAA